jgi:hypothetical protein
LNTLLLRAAAALQAILVLAAALAGIERPRDFLLLLAPRIQSQLARVAWVDQPEHQPEMLMVAILYFQQLPPLVAARAARLT